MDGSERHSLQEKALHKLFCKTYPGNTDISEVLIKVSVLNDFYSANVFSTVQAANHIVALHADNRLDRGDVTLVHDLAKVTMENGTVKNFYSFATKYCSHHKPLDFPVYDSYVDRMLRYFRDADSFGRFENSDLKQYPCFKDVLLQFRSYYRLEPYSLQDIDRYLWLLGKEKFPKQY